MTIDADQNLRYDLDHLQRATWTLMPFLYNRLFPASINTGDGRHNLGSRQAFPIIIPQDPVTIRKKTSSLLSSLDKVTPPMLPPHRHLHPLLNLHSHPRLPLR